MSPRRRRFKLLLDEMMPRREKFPQVNDYHDLKHIVHNRLLCQKQKVDLIGVTQAITPGRLDINLMAHLRRRQSLRMTGRFKKITLSGS